MFMSSHFKLCTSNCSWFMHREVTAWWLVTLPCCSAVEESRRDDDYGFTTSTNFTFFGICPRLLNGVKQFEGSSCTAEVMSSEFAVELVVVLCFKSASHLQVHVYPWAGFAGFWAGSTSWDSAAQFYGVRCCLGFLFHFTVIRSCVVLWYLIL